MTQPATGSHSGENSPAAFAIRHSGRGKFVWQSIVARPVYAVSSRNVLLVGVYSLGGESAKGDELDQLNMAITALVALEQPEHRTCDAVYAILLSENRPETLWKINVGRIRSTLDEHYFAQTRSGKFASKIVPSAVVSFVIQQKPTK